MINILLLIIILIRVINFSIDKDLQVLTMKEFIHHYYKECHIKI